MRARCERIAISNRGLSRAAEHGTTDFTFVVGSREYHCSRFEAKFISERVCCLLSSDCSIDRIENLDLNDCEGCFEAISSIYNGDSIDISDTNCSSLLSVCNWLCNSELETQLVNFAIGPDALSLLNVIDRLILKSTHKCDISLSLNELTLDSLQRLDSTHFEGIVSSAFL
jgi:hypothetical protein